MMISANAISLGFEIEGFWLSFIQTDLSFLLVDSSDIPHPPPHLSTLLVSPFQRLCQYLPLRCHTLCNN